MQVSRLEATYFPGNNTLKTLVSVGDYGKSIHKLANDPNRYLTVVSHSGCPDGSWSGMITAKSLPQRDVRQLLQSYPMKPPAVEVTLLEQHGAIGENATIMTADIMFDMATTLEALKKHEKVQLVLTDHHGGTGKKFLEAYNTLEPESRAFIDKAIDDGRLVVNVDTTESGASHIFNLLNKEKSIEQLKELFDCKSDKALASYRQFMRSYDLTTMQPEAVRKLTRFVAEQVTLDRESQTILDHCRAGIENEFIKDNLVHYLLCYLTDDVFNSRFHYARPGSDPTTVVAPSFHDLNDPSYPGGRSDPNHRVLIKVPEPTKTFVTEVFESCKNFNEALKKVDPQKFIAQVNEAIGVLSQGQPVTFAGERFFAANTTARLGRFMQALVSDQLKKHPDCEYAVLFGNKYNVSLTRAMDSEIDLTDTVKKWLDKNLTQTGGGHPEAVGMQMVGERQYEALLERCHKADIPLGEEQFERMRMVLTPQKDSSPA